eukprot:SAG11_NODE_15829_length_565_cov_0.976395_1_plen_101_part_00
MLQHRPVKPVEKKHLQRYTVRQSHPERWWWLSRAPACCAPDDRLEHAGPHPTPALLDLFLLNRCRRHRDALQGRLELWQDLRCQRLLDDQPGVRRANLPA